MSDENDGRASMDERTREILERVTKRVVPTRKIVSASGQTTNAQVNPEDLQGSFANLGAILPPYDPDILLRIADHAGALRPNVDAYATNIDAFGHTLIASIDLKTDQAREQIGDAIFMERLARSENENGIQAAVPRATEEEISNRMLEIETLQRIERAQVELFLRFCVPGSNLVELRQQTRHDLEYTGNGYWEVMRDGAKRIAQFSHLPVQTMRLMPVDPAWVDTPTRRLVSLDRFENTIEKRRFRSFVQIVLYRFVYFKEFGDPRVMSSRTGVYYPSEADLAAKEPDSAPATEVIHFRIPSSQTTSYGVPRWIGNLLSVLGSRAAEEVNFLFFDNKSVPPMAIVCEGGRLAQGAAEKIQKLIEDKVKGRENFHKVLIIESEPATGPVSMLDNGKHRVRLEPLTQRTEGMFADYDERNIDKLGMSFRLPRMLRGDIRDFNRASAEAALEFAEMQVFQPERNRFDLVMERILNERGVRFWTFQSKGPVVRDPSTLVDMLAKAAPFLTAEEAREILEEIFNRKFRKVSPDWGDLPVPLTLAGYVAGASSIAAPPGTTPTSSASAEAAPATKEQRDQLALITQLQGIAASMSTKADERHTKAFAVSKQADEEEVITVSPTEFRDLFRHS